LIVSLPISEALHLFQKGRVILKFTGFDTVEAASTLINHDFAVPESESVQLAADEYYDWELEGCNVETVAGEQVGVVKGVMRTGGVHLLIVVRDEERDSLIPLVGSIAVKLNPKSKLIVIDPPDGLLDL